jgi:hypothetical protein
MTVLGRVARRLTAIIFSAEALQPRMQRVTCRGSIQRRRTSSGAAAGAEGYATRPTLDTAHATARWTEVW